MTKEKLTVEDELGGIDADGSMHIDMTFPKGTSPQAIKAAMNAVSKITTREAQKIDAMDVERDKYAKEGGRRWKCMVESMRPGVKTFETIISDPKTDRPVPVRLRCGLVIEDGLTRATINAIDYEHSFRMEEIEEGNINRLASMALTSRKVRVPHYKVTVFEEVKNPLPVGRVGHGAVAAANRRAELASA